MENFFGIMLDVSRNGVIKKSKIKQFVDYISDMGYNGLELYSEDLYEVKEYPELGYLRGKYTIEDLKELDSYCQSKGVELVPCIQTLAHFTNFVKSARAKGIVDVNDILLVDEEETYKFIECIFKACAEAFTSRRINIGMDEAHMLGLGAHLDKYGYQNRTEILLRHLKRVSEIAAKYGFKCHMWSDMFIRLTNNGRYYVYEGETVHIDENIKKQLPDNVTLTYWDYYSSDVSHYDRQFNIHRLMANDFYFAGGIHSWNGFAPCNRFTLNSMKAAIESCNKNNVKNIIMTMWGDNGKECSFFNLLPSIFAISEYHKGNFNEEDIKAKFYDKYQLNYDDFMLLDSANYFKDATYKQFGERLNRGTVYSDPFVPMLDMAFKGHERINYLEVANKLDEAKERNKGFEYLFKVQASLCRFLNYKMDLSSKLREAYQNGDKVKLESLLDTFDHAIETLDEFKEDFYNCYLQDNKSYGIEIHNIRLGGLKERLMFCKKMLRDYLDNKVEEIEELKERLIETENQLHVVYQWVISPSDIIHQ